MATSNNSRVWFITGSSQGIGRSLLEAVLATGQRAVATLRNPAALASLQATYPPEQLLLVKLDVTDKKQVGEAFAATKERFGRLDVVVNNAGYGLFGEVEGLPEAEARKQFEVMFWAPVDISTRAVKFMKEVNPAGEGGLILNVSSAGGYRANPCLAFYSASKFALEGFTEALGMEMNPAWNIKTMIIQPGGFTTAWSGDSMVNYPRPPGYEDPSAPSNQFRAMMESIKGKYLGNPDRLSEAILKLADLNRKELPLRLQFGTDSLTLVVAKAEETVRDSKKWADLSHSTNHDWVDKETVMSQLSASH